MTSTSRRFQTVRASTKELLAAGEQPHIEFKSAVVIGSVAKQAAAGANYVAHQPAANVFTIIFGVAEKDSKVPGVKVGSIVGLQDDKGAPLDLDALQLQIGQTIHDSIVPPPAVVMYQENVATKPILVVEVRPTTAPHIVGERWNIRGVGGIQPMKQDQALQIFKNQRLSAWIEEFEGSDPLKGALLALQASVDDLRWRAFTDDGPTEVVDFAPIEAGVRDLGDILQSLDTRVSEVLDGVESLKAQGDEILGSFGEMTAETAWWAAVQGRQRRMITLNTFPSGLGADRKKLVDDLFDDYLGETTDLSAYPANVAEAAAYRTLRRGGSEISSEESAASDLVSAAMWRINGMPPIFGIGWVDDVRDASDLLSTARADREWVKGVEHEVGIVHLPGITSELLSARLGARADSHQRILSIPTGPGVYRIGVPANGAVWPVVFRPGTYMDTSATGSIAAIVENVRGLVTESGGSSWCIEGPAVAIPTS